MIHADYGDSEAEQRSLFPTIVTIQTPAMLLVINISNAKTLASIFSVLNFSGRSNPFRFFAPLQAVSVSSATHPHSRRVHHRYGRRGDRVR